MDTSLYNCSDFINISKGEWFMNYVIAVIPLVVF